MLSRTPADLSVGLSTLGNTSGSTGLAGDRVVLVGGNNVTLAGSLSNGSLTLTIQAADPLAGQSSLFSNANNVSFGTAGNTITASASFSQSVQPGLNAVSAGTTDLTTGGLLFSNSNGISFGLNGSTLTAAHNALTTQTNPAVSGSNGSSTFQTASFGNSNGLSFYLTNGSVVGSYTVPSTAGLLSAVAVSAGATSGTLTGLTFSNSNGISFGLNSGTLTASHNGLTSQSNQAFSAQGGSSTFQTLTFGNANGLSFSNSNGSVVGSYTVPSTAGLISAINVSAGTTSNNLSAVTFSNSNGLSFGLNGSVVTGSYTVPTVTNSSLTLSDGATSLTIGRLALTNLNGITLSLSTTTGGSATIVGSHNALTSQSNQAFSASGGSSTFQTLNFANSNGVTFSNSNGSVVASHNGLTSQSNQALSGSNGSFTFQTASFGNSNGLSFYTTNGSVVGSYTVPTQTNQTIGLYASSQTTGQSSSSTIDARSFTIRGAGNISVGLSAGEFVVSQTGGGGNFSAGASNIGNTSGNTGLVGSQLVIAGGNNITVSGSTNGGSVTLTISGANIGGAQTGISGIQVSDATFTSGTVSFRNANGISFGSSGANGVSASYTVPSTAGLISAVNVSAGTTSNNLSAVTFSNANGVSFGLNGSVVTASHNALTSQSNQAFSASGGSSTFQTLNFANSNGVTFSNSNGSVVASYTVPTVTNSSLTLSDVNTSMTIGRLALTNLNGLTLSLSTTTGGSATVVGSYTVPSTAGLISAVNLSAGTTSNNLSAFVASNSNNVSFGLNGSTLTATATFNQTNQTLGVYGSSNTTGQSSSSTYDARSLTIVGQGGVSVGWSNSSLLISGNTGGGAGFSAGVSTGGNTSGDTGVTGSRLVFAGGNNITLSQATDANGATITVSGATIAGQPVNFSAGTTSNNLGSVVFSNSNQVSFGLNGSTITGSVPGTSSVLGTGILSVSTNGNTVSLGVGAFSAYATGNTTQSSSGTPSLTALSFRGEGNLSVGISNGSVVFSQTNAVNFSAGTTSNNLGSIVFSNSNNVSFGLNGSTITATVTVSQTNQTLGIYGSSQTTGQSSSSTYDARSLTVVGMGGVSVGWSNSSLLISGNTGGGAGFSAGVSTGGNTSGNTGLTGSNLVFAGVNNITLSQLTDSNGATISISGATVAGQPVNFSAGTTSNNLGSVVFSNSNQLSFGLNGSTITGSVPGTSSLSATGIFSISTNGATISLGVGPASVYAVGNTTRSSSGTPSLASWSIHGSNLVSIGVSNGSIIIDASHFPLTHYVPMHPASTGSQTMGAQGVTSASAFFYPIDMPAPVQFNCVRVLNALSYITSNANQIGQTITSSFGLYSNNAGTLSQISSSSFSLAVTGSGVSATLSCPLTTGTTGYSYGTVTASTTAQIHSLFGTAGNRLVCLQFGNTMSLPQGQYWLGVMHRHSTTGANGGISEGLAGNVVAAAVNAGGIGVGTTLGTTNSGYRAYRAMGVYTSTGSAGYGGTALPSSVIGTGIAHTVTQYPLMSFASTN